MKRHDGDKMIVPKMVFMCYMSDDSGIHLHKRYVCMVPALSILSVSDIPGITERDVCRVYTEHGAFNTQGTADDVRWRLESRVSRAAMYTEADYRIMFADMEKMVWKLNKRDADKRKRLVIYYTAFCAVILILVLLLIAWIARGV
jgi:hypothetical protein